ncbi:hypothetical protein N1851_032899 [Merluccius polli]|uniref:Uncharacterized protein n=1 Tax=Merluccius polli TaxID=89951 RepID=A0AA47NP57_MERPO|nr:hypothetical protein N1851_032899 [Merluccius polli]
MNIHLVALFHMEDVKKYGFDPILQPLINDIKTLECHGLDLPFATERVHGTMSGNWEQLRDARNSGLLVDVISVVCLKKDDAQHVYSEDDPKIILRGKEIFEMHCNELQSDPQKLSMFGLKKNSTLNNLQFFHLPQFLFGHNAQHF